MLTTFGIVSNIDNLWFLDKRLCMQPCSGKLATFCQISTKKARNIPRPEFIRRLNMKRYKCRTSLNTRLNASCRDGTNTRTKTKAATPQSGSRYASPCFLFVSIFWARNENWSGRLLSVPIAISSQSYAEIAEALPELLPPGDW